MIGSPLLSVAIDFYKILSNMMEFIFSTTAKARRTISSLILCRMLKNENSNNRGL